MVVSHTIIKLLKMLGFQSRKQPQVDTMSFPKAETPVFAASPCCVLAHNKACALKKHPGRRVGGNQCGNTCLHGQDERCREDAGRDGAQRTQCLSLEESEPSLKVEQEPGKAGKSCARHKAEQARGPLAIVRAAPGARVPPSPLGSPVRLLA